MYSYKILQNCSKDLFHSSILTFEKKSYLFNCSDGTQRNLSHQNIKFNKISHIFFNSASIDAYLGSYGFSMSRNETICNVQAEPNGKNTEENSKKKSKDKNDSNKKNKIQSDENISENKNRSKDYKIKDYLIPLMQEANKPLYFWGPPPLRSNFDFCKYFFVEKVKDYIYEYNPKSNRFELRLFTKEEFDILKENKNEPNLNLNEADIFLDYFEDENLKIFPISSTIYSENSNERLDCAMSYFCEPHLRQRTFLPEKAKALGLKPGPSYSLLQSGKSVFLEDGKEIKPEDVLGDQMPSSCFAVLYSPNLAHSRNLMENLKEKNFFEKQENKNITLIVHILGNQEIINSDEYKNFISEISAKHLDVLHIVDCKETNFKFMLNEEKHKIKYLLSKADERMYKAGYFKEEETLPKINLSNEFKNLNHSKNVINSNCGFEYNLYPVHKKGIIQNKIYEPYIFDKKNTKFMSYIKSADKLIEEKKQTEDWDNNVNLLCEKVSENQINNQLIDLEMKIEFEVVEQKKFENEPEIMFLGTSSMKPGLYRNVSSIYVKLSEKYNNYGLLLDCGEGTYQQIYDYFGEKLTNEILDKIKIIFLTHKHGDHMLGALKVIQEIEKIKILKQNYDIDNDRVYIIAPKTLKKWIIKNIDNENSIKLKDMFILIDNRDINPSMNPVYEKYAKQNNPYVGFTEIKSELSEEFLSEKINNFFNFLNETVTQKKKQDLEGQTLSNYSSNENKINEGTNFVNRIKNRQYFNKSEVEKILEFYNYIHKNLGLNFFSVEVFHCDESFGCFLEHFNPEDPQRKRQWKISYSGDTRPCVNFHNFAAFSSLFIHEATFDDELFQDAKEKMHSTMEESINLGKQCKSWRVALTHFSPRYIKLLPYKSSYMEEKVVFVNDFFKLKLSDFSYAYTTGKRLSSLLESASEKQIL